MKKSLVLSEVEGFSLIEVLVFVTVLGLFFVAALTVITFNLKNMKVQEHKILATRFAEEAVEWIKQEKEDNWSDFILHGAGNYCLNNNVIDWSAYSGSNPGCTIDDYTLGTFFKRELTIVKSGSPTDQVEGIVKVSWQDMGTVLSVPIKTVFKLLE